MTIGRTHPRKISDKHAGTVYAEFVDGLIVFLANASESGASAATMRKLFLDSCLTGLQTRMKRRLTLSNPGSRPCLQPGEGHLSLSHTQRWIGLAYSSTSAVGLDLEERTRRLANPEAIYRRFLASKGHDEFERPPSLEELLKLWTQKEALLKIEGKGLDEEIAERGDLTMEGAAARWRIWDLAALTEFPSVLCGSLACAHTQTVPPEIIRVPLSVPPQPEAGAATPA